MRSLPRITTAITIIASVSVWAACEREHRRFDDNPPSAAGNIRQSELQPGSAQLEASLPGPYEDNAYAVSEGKRLYGWFNCVGCHSHGGGNIGPPLMDDKWIYGSKPENIYATILEGRPNGMPSFRGKISDQQTWQIVAYVRSLSGQLSKDVSGGRDDGMNYKPSEQSTKKEQPKSKMAEQP